MTFYTITYCNADQWGHPNGGQRENFGAEDAAADQWSEEGMIRLETLIELTFLNSSFSSLSSY